MKKTLIYSTNIFSTNNRFQKTISQRSYHWGNTPKVVKKTKNQRCIISLKNRFHQ